MPDTSGPSPASSPSEGVSLTRHQSGAAYSGHPFLPHSSEVIFSVQVFRVWIPPPQTLWSPPDLTLLRPSLCQECTRFLKVRQNARQSQGATSWTPVRGWTQYSIGAPPRLARKVKSEIDPTSLPDNKATRLRLRMD